MRQNRIEYNGAVYHVMQRGNNKENIFQNESDKQFFIAELTNSKKKYDFDLFGYVLLDNHYHLLIRTGETPLSKVMQRLNSLYSRYYNRVYERCDHLFGLRYKSIIIEDEKYLFALLRYLHWNPVRSGLVRKVVNYKWSSDYYYRNNQDGLVNIKFIFDIISKDRNIAVNQYLRLIEDEAAMKIDLGRIIGDNSRQELFEEERKAKSLDVILVEAVSGDTDAYALIRSGNRKKSLKPLKVKYVKGASRHGYTLVEIANYINMGITSVHRLSKSEN